MMLNVNTEKSYPVYLGRSLLRQLEEYADFSTARIAFLVDAKVLALFPAFFARRLVIPFDSDEEEKDLAAYKKLVAFLRQQDFGPADCLINVGGGKLSDLGGFVASTYKRGIRHINIPTTTLAQIDAAHGGKNGLDLWQTKNLLGTIYQPQLVIIDYDFLTTLPERHYYNGLYEALKIALLFDEELFRLLEAPVVFDNIETIVQSAVKHKIAVVEEDEYDRDKRRVLNFGHSVGHALESCCVDLLHGEAVMYGMMIMCENPKLRNRLAGLAQRWQLPPLPSLDHQLLAKALVNDKKNRGSDNLTCIVLKDIKDWEFRQLPLTTLQQRIKEYEQSTR